MTSPSKSKSGLGRGRALTARAQRLPVVRSEQTPDGGLTLVVRITPKRWLGWFTGSTETERTFNLDRLGAEVYQACDGKTDVRAIIRKFAATHKISVAEAEISVTTFLKTLVSKGLVALAVKRQQLDENEGGT